MMVKLLLLVAVAALLAAPSQAKPARPRGVRMRVSAAPRVAGEHAVEAQRLGQERCAGCRPGTKPQHPLAGRVAVQGPARGAPSLRMTGGSDATDGQLPWMALIIMDASSLCGGSIISENYVLTSAQCASGYAQFRVCMGDIDVEHTSPNYKYSFTYKTIVHEDYEEDRILNDIALLELFVPITFTEAIRPVKLPSSADVTKDLTGKTALVSGWGSVGDGAKASRWLHVAEQPILDQTRCVRFYPDYVTASNICGDGEAGVSTCDADAGGPLQLQGDDGVWVQVGVSSFQSDQGCLRGYPSVYTRVTEYLQWIQSNTGLQL